MSGGAIAGWLAIVLVLFATVINIVPGAVSLMGLMISISAVALSLFSISKSGRKYFGVTFAFALADIFLVNDALRILYPSPLPFNVKAVLYGIAFLLLAICFFAAYKLVSAQKPE